MKCSYAQFDRFTAQVFLYYVVTLSKNENYLMCCIGYKSAMAKY